MAWPLPRRSSAAPPPVSAPKVPAMTPPVPAPVAPSPAPTTPAPIKTPAPRPLSPTRMTPAAPAAPTPAVTPPAPAPVPAVPQQEPSPHPAVQKQIGRLNAQGIRVSNNMPVHYTPEQQAGAMEHVAAATEFMHSHFPGLAGAHAQHGTEYNFAGPQRTEVQPGVFDVTMGTYDPDSAHPKIDINEGAEQTLWHESGHLLDHLLKGRAQDQSAGAMNFASQDQSHPLNQLATKLKATRAHDQMMLADPAAMRHEYGTGNAEDAERHGYLTDNREVLARFFNRYLHYQATQAGHEMSEAPSQTDEQYSPQDLEEHGTFLRNALAHERWGVREAWAWVGCYLDPYAVSCVRPVHKGPRAARASDAWKSSLPVVCRRGGYIDPNA